MFVQIVRTGRTILNNLDEIGRFPQDHLEAAIRNFADALRFSSVLLDLIGTYLKYFIS
jgi:hypothetical protein